MSHELSSLLGAVMRRWKKYTHSASGSWIPVGEADLYLNDYVRHHLKQVSAYCFPRIFSDGPMYMLFTHLHALTGKCPYTKEQIVGDIDSWVSGSIHGRPKKFDSSATKYGLDRIFSDWKHPEPFGFLSFREYSNDFLRWGTSGGAPKSEIAGSKYRTKWAWAYANLPVARKGVDWEKLDLYSAACSAHPQATAALKEEPQKTREIISTSLPSYLCQCYLLYRWGKPHIPSPAVSATWVARFETIHANWYGCLDGDRFDHCVPLNFIMEVVDRLGNADEDCRKVADAEIEDLRRLRVEWGHHSWKWKGGVLSGWRLTSILGTLASLCSAWHIL
ncbi:hypothetical protein J437_LFUL010502 [Ladona fulva]|uniref:Uncharacterized protein n=1 Tax=Ladona fulva TaxID=123851 RepID=A0A8K0KBV3_LADFU|nr:hypothetical protein J437_LFUL010502 [Ladona fulva]